MANAHPCPLLDRFKNSLGVIVIDKDRRVSIYPALALLQIKRMISNKQSSLDKGVEASDLKGELRALKVCMELMLCSTGGLLLQHPAPKERKRSCLEADKPLSPPGIQLGKLEGSGPGIQTLPYSARVEKFTCGKQQELLAQLEGKGLWAPWKMELCRTRSGAPVHAWRLIRAEIH